MNGSERELPDRPGAKVFYFNGIIDDEVPRYYHSKVRKNGPTTLYGGPRMRIQKMYQNLRLKVGFGH